MVSLAKPKIAAMTESHKDEVAHMQQHVDALRQAGVSDSFRMAMRELASGVSVVTTGSGAGRAGLTATSVTSLSMAPASLLVCVQKSSTALGTIVENGRFAVNLLGHMQQPVADLFAGRGGVRAAARFTDPNWRDGDTGVPVLTTALAAIECVLAQTAEWHTHCVLFGTVAAVRLADAGDALIYCRGQYAAPLGLT